MKTKTYIQVAGLALTILCLAQNASAIKIEVPDEYKAQVESAKAAERAERSPEMENAGESVAETEKSGTESATEAAPRQANEGGGSSNGDFIKQSVVEAEDAAGNFEEDLGANEGLVSGQVVDEETGAPVSGVAILIEGLDVATVTSNEGRYSLGPVAAGEYTLSFVKSGYIEANVTDYQIAGGEISVFPFALPPRPAEMSDEVYELQDFTVTAEEANQMMLNLDLRMKSDSIMNILSSEDLSRFADSDVGDAVKRIAGISVQEGKFAVIRGLEERYSSTLFNGVPVPSPDPERQSVPLDLFPSEIVKNLSVTKTFDVQNPSNSAGGTIDIRSNVFSDELTIKGTVGGGINENAQDIFLEPSQGRESIDFDAIENLRAVEFQEFGGVPVERSSSDTIDHNFDIEVGDTREIFGKTVRYLASIAFDKSFDTRLGMEAPRKARPSDVVGGEIADLGFTEQRFDVTESTAEEQLTGLFSAELDLDDRANHTVGYTAFYTKTEEKFGAIRDNGVFPGLVPDEDFGTDFERWVLPGGIRSNFSSRRFSLGDLFRSDFETGVLGNPDPADRTRFWEQATFFDLLVFEEERTLEIHQLSGSHEFLADREDALHFSWAGSYSEATQEEIDAFRLGGIKAPDPAGVFLDSPAPSDFQEGFLTGEKGGGFDGFSPDRSWRRIEETQEFLRADIRYESGEKRNWSWEASGGIFSSKTERDTDQFFTRVLFRKIDNAVASPDLEESIRNSISPRPANNEFDPAAVARGERDSDGFYLRGKTSFWDKVDFVFGARFESFAMSTSTSTAGGTFFNSDLLQDDDDDPTNSGTPEAALRNTQLLGVNGGLPLLPGFEGEIDQDEVLPSVSLTYRTPDRLRITAAFSRTNVRPSFKEFTFITVRNPQTLTLESGNPALKPSDVDSVDLRIDKTFNDAGDRASVALFYKTVDEPIEKTNLSNTDIFFNNPNRAEIKGIEIEGRKFLAGMGPEWLDYFSVGGNVTFIDATVDVPETFRERLQTRFGLSNPDRSRRLFSQPEWLVNFDVGFDHPDWGTQATLSLFAQSDVLDTSGGFDGSNFEPDLFASSFEEVNFSLRQRLTDHLSLKVTIKNLTDSKRGREFDAGGGDSIEREFRLGREYGLSITGTF